MSIQTLRKGLANLYAIVPMCLLIFMATFSAQAKPINIPSFTGKELFKGIFFAQGQVAQLIPEIQEKVDMDAWLNNSEKVEYKKFMNEVIVAIDKKHPSFFKNFQLKVQSGSHVRISQEMSRASKILSDMVYELTNTSEEEVNGIMSRTSARTSGMNKLKTGELTKDEIGKEIKKLRSTNNSRSKDACISVQWLLVLVAVAVAAAVAIVFINWVGFDSPNNPSSRMQSDIYKESVINSIAINLRV